MIYFGIEIDSKEAVENALKLENPSLLNQQLEVSEALKHDDEQRPGGKWKGYDSFKQLYYKGAKKEDYERYEGKMWESFTQEDNKEAKENNKGKLRPNQILVRNVPFDATEEELRAIFEQAGYIQHVKVLKGIAFIKF